MKHPPRTAPRLPNEILLNIFKPLGAESTRDLEPLTLVNQHWHEVAASLLLATISISSLRGILDLCSLTHPSPTARRTGGARPSSIVKYTRTIVLSGETWCNTTDLEKQLLGFPDSYEALGKEKKALRNLGIYQSPQEMSRIIRDTLPHLVSLERLEWYGRFPGDYYLVAQLQQASIIRSLVYGVDSQGYNEIAASYCQHAFSFTDLKSVEVGFNWPDGDGGTPFEMFNMMRSNPELQRTSYDIKDSDVRTLGWHLIELITCPPVQYGEDLRLFVWPNLRSLDLEISQRTFWEDPEGVELFTQFLVAHSTLEELILREWESDELNANTYYPFSLAPHPKALPRLRKLSAPECFLACILESRAACTSVQTVIDNSIASYEDDLWPDVETTCAERILECFENASHSRVTDFDWGILDLFRDGGDVSDEDWVASEVQNEDEYAATDAMIFWLNMLPNLKIIGYEIAAAYIHMFDDHSKEEAMIDLGERVPELKGIQLFDRNVQLHYMRTSDEDLGIEIGKDCPEDFKEHPQQGAFSDWVHRPVSRRTKQVKWMSQTKVDSCRPIDYF